FKYLGFFSNIWVSLKLITTDTMSDTAKSPLSKSMMDSENASATGNNNMPLPLPHSPPQTTYCIISTSQVQKKET
ncbi:hypothetical protein Csa_023765, partial [Cucumis sativus]